METKSPGGYMKSPNGKWLEVTDDSTGSAVLIAIDDISRVTELRAPGPGFSTAKITFKSGSRNNPVDGLLESEFILVREFFKDIEMTLGYDTEQ